MIRRTAIPAGLAVLLVLCVVALANQRKVLYEGDSPYNSILVTEDSRGLRTLYFDSGGVRQSVVKVGDPDHIELPYARVTLVGLAFVSKPQRVLVVGLGGGTIPGFLHKHYPRMTIDVVDIDPDVVQVAKRFFGFREDATLRAHVADGRGFIEARQGSHDVIILDAFGSDNIPYHLATREFLQAVRRALTPKGVVIGNVWSRGSNPLYDDMVRTYQDVFPTLRIFDVQGAGNKILVALPRKVSIDRGQLAQRARSISEQQQFGFDLGDLVTYGYRASDQPDPRGRVLTDQKNARKAG
jgi:spermidine synthase